MDKIISQGKTMTTRDWFNFVCNIGVPSHNRGLIGATRATVVHSRKAAMRQMCFTSSEFRGQNNNDGGEHPVGLLSTET